MYHDLEKTHHLDIEYDASTFDTDPSNRSLTACGRSFPSSSERVGGKRLCRAALYPPQDFTLFVLHGPQNIGVWKEKLRWIAEKGGMALLITHPDYMRFNGRKPGFDEYPAATTGNSWSISRRPTRASTGTPCRGMWRGSAGPSMPPWSGDPSPKFMLMLSCSFYECDNRVMRCAEALQARRRGRCDLPE